MCVPGVHAWATDGVSISSSSAPAITPAAEAARDQARDIPSVLNADALTLPPYGFAKIVELVFHYIIDRFASGIDVIAYLFDDVVNRYAIDQLAAAIHRCP